MNQITENFLDKVETLARSVKQDLKNKGVVVPSKGKDGSYRFGNYRMVKENSGFYSIFDKDGQAIATNINLPQTAAVIANDLALGKLLDIELLKLDTNYGYRDFDCELFESKCAKYQKNDPDKFLIYNTRYLIAKEQRSVFKNQILAKFDKLRRVR